MTCKKCNEEITYLDYTETVAHYGTYDLINGFEYYEDNSHHGGNSLIFYTPCCNEDVAESKEEADEFLQRKEGEKI